MRRWTTLVALALLPGCSLFGGRSDGPLTDQQFCARQADNDPVVKEMIMKGVGNPHFAIEGQDMLRAARQDATNACLRSRGLIPQGGVERQKPH